MKDFKGKVAFITGGASGIGLGIAKTFARYGMKVIIADSRQDALDEAMDYFKKTGQPVHPIRLDVTDRAAYAQAADEAEAVFEKIHVLVNNAGVSCGGAVQDLTYKDWDFGLGVNLGGVINGIVTVLPRILKTWRRRAYRIHVIYLRSYGLSRHGDLLHEQICSGRHDGMHCHRPPG